MYTGLLLFVSEIIIFIEKTTRVFVVDGTRPNVLLSGALGVAVVTDSVETIVVSYLEPVFVMNQEGLLDVWRLLTAFAEEKRG